MKRKKRMILVSNCILNVNCKVEGIANYDSGLRELINGAFDLGYGIIQLPCVEHNMCGIKRWGQVVEQLDHPQFRERCVQMLKPIVQQVEDFVKNGYEVSGIIGLDGSPSCGVNFTCSADWGGEGRLTSEDEARVTYPSRKGVMMDVLEDLLTEFGITLPFFGINEQNPEKDLKIIIDNLKGIINNEKI